MTAEVYERDCLRFLEQFSDNSVSLLTTDPAYDGMNQHLQLGSGRIVGDYGTKSEWFSEYSDDVGRYERLLSELRRVCSPSAHLYFMFDNYSLLTLGPIIREFFAVKSIICWDKVNFGMGHYYRRRHEFVLFATNHNSRKLSSKAFPDVWRQKRIYRPAYPTQKPVEIFSRMMIASGQPAGLVVDPFVGSGSSAIAALRAGLPFKGCDVSSDAVAMARTRIRTFVETGEDPLQVEYSSPWTSKV